MLKKFLVQHSAGLFSEFWYVQYPDYFEVFSVIRSTKKNYFDSANKFQGQFGEYKLNNEGEEIVSADCFENLEDWPIRFDSRINYHPNLCGLVFGDIRDAKGRKKFFATIPQGLLGTWQGNGNTITFLPDHSFVLQGENKDCSVFKLLSNVSPKFEVTNWGFLRLVYQINANMRGALYILDLNSDKITFSGHKKHLLVVYRRSS